MPQQLRRLTAAVLFALVSLGLVGPIAYASAQEATATPVAAAANTTATPEATTPMATATPAATMAATPAATTAATTAPAAPTATPVKALAQTGTESTTLAVLGIVLLGVGFTAVGLSRRAN